MCAYSPMMCIAVYADCIAKAALGAYAFIVGACTNHHDAHLFFVICHSYTQCLVQNLPSLPQLTCNVSWSNCHVWYSLQTCLIPYCMIDCCATFRAGAQATGCWTSLDSMWQFCLWLVLWPLLVYTFKHLSPLIEHLEWILATSLHCAFWLVTDCMRLMWSSLLLRSCMSSGHKRHLNFLPLKNLWLLS